MDILLNVYQEWQHNDSVNAIVVKGAGGKVPPLLSTLGFTQNQFSDILTHS